MNILTFAHLKEAEYFLEKDNFIQIDYEFDGLYKNEHDFLLITGEGEQNVLLRLISVLTTFKEINHIYNIGICGGLNPKIQKDQIFWCRTAYSSRESKEFEFKTFSSNDSVAQMDIISSYKRILTKDEKEKLAIIAPLVDREAWANGYCAFFKKINISFLKIVSDEVDDQNFCSLVIEKALTYSRQLYLEYKKIKPKVIDDKHDHLLDYYLSHEHLFFSKTQSRILKNILLKLELQKFSEDEIKKICPIEELLQITREKDRTREFLTRLQEFSSPLNSKIKNQLDRALLPFRISRIETIIDQNLEDDSLKIIHHITSEKDIKDLVRTLESFDLNKFKNIFQGNLEDV